MKRGRSMHAKRAMPLSLRVASIYAMLVAATLLVAAGLALQFTRNQLSGQVDNQLNGRAKSFDARVTQGVKQETATGTAVPVAVADQTYVWLQNTSFSYGEGAVVAIRTADAPKLFRPSGAYDLSHELESVLPSVMSVSTGKRLNVRSRSGAAVRLLRVPIQDASNHVAGILVLGAEQSKVVNHAVWNLLKGIGAASAIGLVFATALGLVAVRRTLRPLEEMSHEVESIQETDDLSKRLSGRGPRDEVGRLAEGFDPMLGRLQEAFLSHRRLPPAPPR